MESDMVYKGYLIRTGLLGDYFIGKDGHFFSCLRSLEDAKKAIDELVE